MTLDPGGTRLLQSVLTNTASEVASFDAATGTLQWKRRFPIFNPGRVVVAPSGTVAYFTGTESTQGGGKLVVFAIDTSDGHTLWRASYRYASGAALTLSPDGKRLFVAGEAGAEFLTVSYVAASGRQLWSTEFGEPGPRYLVPEFMFVVATATRVIAFGAKDGDGRSGFVTAGYIARSGKHVWTRYRSLRQCSQPAGLELSSDGQTIVEAGMCDSKLTVLTMRSSDGAPGWLRQLQGGLNSIASALAVGQDGTIFVTGRVNQGRSSRSDFVTLAYRP
jgi:outer membrane protein assembly factor BamB